MENLRWIMLGIGLAVIVLIYLFGRSRNRVENNDYLEPVAADEMPKVSTQDFDDEEHDDPSSPGDDIPFVPSEINHFELNEELVDRVTASVDDGLVDVITKGAGVKVKQQPPRDEPDVEETESVADLKNEDAQEHYDDDLIVIHVEAKEAYFGGLELLKVINQLQLKFGDMNIYHAYDESGEIMFSMSNMIKPGHFEPEHFSEMRTPGVILFMQASMVTDANAAFDRLLHCAQRLASELRAQLTTSSRMRISDNEIIAFRNKADYFSRSSVQSSIA